MQDYGPNRPSAFHSLRVQLVEIFHLFTSNPSVLTFCWLCAGNFRPFSLQKPPRLFLIAGELTVRWRAVSCSGCVFHPKWRHGALSIRKPLIITVAPLIISSTTTDFHVTFTLTNRYSDGHKGRSVDGMVGFREMPRSFADYCLVFWGLVIGWLGRLSANLRELRCFIVFERLGCGSLG